MSKPADDIDRRSAFFDSFENAALILSGIKSDELGKPTPCPNYDVSGLVDHIVEAGRRAAALGRGQVPPPGDTSTHMELSDAPGQLRLAAEDAAEGWEDDSKLSKQFTMPWGERCTGADLVDMYLTELAAHAWDLARSSGQIEELDPSVAIPALDAARAMMKPEYRNAVEPGSPFAEQVSLFPAAGDWDRFVAFMVRDPRSPLSPQ